MLLGLHLRIKLHIVVFEAYKRIAAFDDDICIVDITRKFNVVFPYFRIRR